MTETASLVIFTDGGARGNPGPAAIGVQVLTQDNVTRYEQATTIGPATNNEAEYQAFFNSLKWLLQQPDLAKLQKVSWKLDSLLVVEQLNGHWKIKQPHLKTLIAEIQQKLHEVPCPFTITHVPRELNRRADQLVNQALDAA